MRLFMATILSVGFAATSAPAQAPQGDPEAGERVFARCRACHNIDNEQNKIGPTLMNLWGRQAGSLEGYSYSDGMVAYGEEQGIVWNDETLMEYLIDPRGHVQGTKMAFAGLKDEQDRADVIAYMKQFSEQQ